MFKQATCSKFAFLFLTGLVSLIIAACGGGGGGVGGGGETPPGTNYTGVTTRAIITPDNAATLLLGAYQLGQAGETPPVMGLSLEPTTVLGPSRFQVVADSLTALMARIELTGSGHYPTARQVFTDSQTIAGECGGSALVTSSLKEDPGAFIVSATFNNYCEDGMTMSGESTITGTGRLQETEGKISVDSFTGWAFNNLSFKSGTDDFTLDGDISFSSPSSTNAIITMNIRLRNNTTRLVYQVVDLKYNYVNQGSYLALNTSGKYYDPIHGYVDLDTPDPLQFFSSDDLPSAGTLRATGGAKTVGGEDTWATMTFDGNTNPHIETCSGT